MAPKDTKKKVIASKRQDESPNPSVSVEEYPITHIRVVVIGMTPQVTRGHVYKVAETIILYTIGVKIPQDSQWGIRPIFIWPRSRTDFIQVVQEDQATLD